MEHGHGPEEHGEHVYEDGHVHDHAGEYNMPEPPETLETVTAFLVVVMPDGTAHAYADVNMPIKVERGPSLNDMYGASAQVMKDITIMQQTPVIVNNTVQGLMMAMAQQAEAMKTAKIAEKLASKGIHVPR